ncbi:alpha-ketoglutarate-dependent dioxygenase AlkB family protein [Formosa algae]|uniref:Alkylated DNA repair dioxygenase AlkB n=1 Tax=Formosa algae TaxID=225843 RepID=A0A9X1CC03_9FLAO|nr:alpha-ketoglutarate-dependent dioxygenase AlkB [Formosa algae]MBP1839659.1 alkylated DNA repair dioxygenase AlkB [Formosa algae]MDQ0334963.1 alkylated DNA repair dioxygenase AlkB [Formosa algae]OEI81615.1 2OG-Fe(II) oxygenase [Formosa algae]
MLFKNEVIPLQMPDAEVIYYPSFFSQLETDQLYQDLLQTIAWQQDDITLFGKTVPQPRLTALYANNNKPYSYSGIDMYPKHFNPTLLKIKNKVEDETEHTFTSCLCNLYRNGQDSNGWHSDNEKELGERPIIASVSFGAERIFHFKHRRDSSLKQKLILNHGSLLIMKGDTQKHWLHQLPKTKKDIGNRINLTFRIIY